MDGRRADPATATWNDETVTGTLIRCADTEFYRIDGVQNMAPFLMTVVSASDLWMFVSSNGALTAGRGDADHACFPYETDDRIHRTAGLAGPVTVIARTRAGRRETWQPFAAVPLEECRRSLSKSILGDRLVLEEHHDAWMLTVRSTWAPSAAFGWVRRVELEDHSGEDADYDVLDGLLDVMPGGVAAHTEQVRSNLVDAYKRSETGPWGSLAVYSLEALISDRADPAEALSATVVWSSGFDDATIDLDARAVDAMTSGAARERCSLLTGRPGAYLLRGPVHLSASGAATWTMVIDTALDHADVADLAGAMTSVDLLRRVDDDIERESTRLADLIGGADADQSTADGAADAHHVSNVLFNSMRGGIFPYGHAVPVADLTDFVRERNVLVADGYPDWFGAFEPWVDAADLRRVALDTDDPDLIRLVLEYLPLTFSRRHGDPSRPWNRFSIDVRTDDGEDVLAYEGNWRDIFQNWEALLQSYPAYFPNVVAKFVNASTIDGYNPYRISRAGIDWEVPDPDDPWSHIGYWGDHQIVYLLRLIEAWERHDPGELREWVGRRVFVYADVPYVVAGHDDIVVDPRNTITFDTVRAAEIADREQHLGGDGRLLFGTGGSLVRVSLLEKLLVPALGKLSNFVPAGGIWLNTQRPEWNDANNALTGPGLSMVTLFHLRRYTSKLAAVIADVDTEFEMVSNSVATWLADLHAVFAGTPPDAALRDDAGRRTMVDALGRSASAHRCRVVKGSGGIGDVDVALADVTDLCASALAHLDATIATAQRSDGLYDSYNLVSFPDADSACVDRLGVMLEGQVAALSSGVLDAKASADVVDALYESAMYRPDQDSFMLYPAIDPGSFLSRNTLSADAGVRVLAAGVPEQRLRRVVVTDSGGAMHFHPDAVNAKTLDDLLRSAGCTDAQRAVLRDAYEEVFDHRSFTGRSGRMYGYEGLGSIYWHMVAKLLLAVQENYWAALDTGESTDRLVASYRRIRGGLGFRKDPRSFGAIPTDCYSHTPAHAGAQQPGMTGQVKEEVLTRLGELGFRVVQGSATLSPGLIPPGEVFPVGADGMPASAEFSVCGVPMTMSPGADDLVTVVLADGRRHVTDGLDLGRSRSRELFARHGSLTRIEWTIGRAAISRWRAL